MTLTVTGLILSALGAVVIAVFEPDPTDLFSQIEDAVDEFRATGSSLAAHQWNSLRRPTFEEDSFLPLMTTKGERLIRLWLGWGLFVIGILLQICGEVGLTL